MACSHVIVLSNYKLSCYNAKNGEGVKKLFLKSHFCNFLYDFQAPFNFFSQSSAYVEHILEAFFKSLWNNLSKNNIGSQKSLFFGEGGGGKFIFGSKPECLGSKKYCLGLKFIFGSQKPILLVNN